jgi:hypothetical protein
MFSFDYCSEDIANALVKLSELDIDGVTFNEVEEALFSLKCICENEWNDTKYRTLWRVLEGVTKEAETF